MQFRLLALAALSTMIATAGPVAAFSFAKKFSDVRQCYKGIGGSCQVYQGGDVKVAGKCSATVIWPVRAISISLSTPIIVVQAQSKPATDIMILDRFAVHSDTRSIRVPVHASQLLCSDFLKTHVTAACKGVGRSLSPDSWGFDFSKWGKL